MGQDIETLYDNWRKDQDDVRGLDKLFIIGCAKSGTTWLADLLNAHDEIVVRGEGCFAWQLVPILSQAFRVFNEHQKSLDPITHLGDGELLLAARTLIDSQLARYVRESKRDRSKVRVVGDKTPQHTVGMGPLNQLYPRSKFIHILRDPRDTATSAWFHFGKTDGRSFEEYIEFYITRAWPLNVTSARQSGQAIGPSRYREVRYEDLKAQPTELFEGLLKFISVSTDGEMVRKCVNAASFDKKSGGRQPGQKDNSSFYRSGTCGDWRNHLPVELAGRCCQAIAPLMTACGYDPACEPALATSSH